MTRYCPNGHGAFDDQTGTCPQCGAPLRATPPAEDAAIDHDAPIVWLATAANEVEATMWADTIRGQGIPVLVRPGGPGAGAWASAATFEHDIYVREPDLAAARDAMGAIDPPIVRLSPALRPRRRAPRVRPRSRHRAE